MPLQILAPGIDEAVSADIVVVVGLPVNVGAFRSDEERLDHEFRGVIYRKGADGFYNPTNFALSRDTPNQVIYGPGIYQVRRSGGITTATGVQID